MNHSRSNSLTELIDLIYLIYQHNQNVSNLLFSLYINFRSMCTPGQIHNKKHN